jgi:hypothetical protein
MQACAVREVWAASRTPPLLPTAPAARLGTVAHRLLEEAGLGYFTGKSSGVVENRWDALLSAAEDEASRSWLDRHLVPFAAVVHDFEVRRLRAIAAARSIAADVAAAKGIDHGSQQYLRVGYEVAVSTPDGRAGGRIDVVCVSDDGPVLKDYKSGGVYDRSSGRNSVRPEYAAQLKLYAAIYAAMTGTWPARLELVPVAGLGEPVPFTPDECVDLLNQAITLRDCINSVVTTNEPMVARAEKLATPAQATCEYCAYRPQCPAYVKSRQHKNGLGWPLDVRGHLVSKQLLGNGRLSLALDSEESTLHVRGIQCSAERHPALSSLNPGDMIAGFNLKQTASPTSFEEGPLSVFYQIPE